MVLKYHKETENAKVGSLTWRLQRKPLWGLTHESTRVGWLTVACIVLCKTNVGTIDVSISHTILHQLFQVPLLSNYTFSFCLQYSFCLLCMANHIWDTLSDILSWWTPSPALVSQHRAQACLFPCPVACLSNKYLLGPSDLTGIVPWIFWTRRQNTQTTFDFYA